MRSNEKKEAPIAPNHRKRNFWLIFLLIFFLLLAIGAFLYWFFVWRFYVYTEDAYVTGNQVFLSSEISGNVTAIYADEPDFVQEGQLVVLLDTTDYLIAFDEAKASLAETVRNVGQLFEVVQEKEAEVALKRAELRQMRLDLDHRDGLIDSGAVSLEDYENAQTAVATAQAALDLAVHELESAKIAVQNTTVATHPLVEDAKAQLREAYLDLLRCEVSAPVTGYVSKRTVQVGDSITVGESLMMIVPLFGIWVEANYKETQLKHVRIGQPVSFTADIYGSDMKYHGNVVGFSAGTGSAFALLPPEMASGNWIKIVQRLPVRITIDPQDLCDHPLFLGLSLRTSVDVHDTSGRMLSTCSPKRPIYQTNVFDYTKELADFESTISTIIQENISGRVALNYFNRSERSFRHLSKGSSRLYHRPPRCACWHSRTKPLRNPALEACFGQCDIDFDEPFEICSKISFSPQFKLMQSYSPSTEKKLNLSKTVEGQIMQEGVPSKRIITCIVSSYTLVMSLSSEEKR